MADQNTPIDVYYDMDIAQICAHFGKSRNTVDKAVAKLVKNYPNSGWKYKNPETRRITIKAEGVEVLSTYFRKEKHEISTVEAELRMENEKLNAILLEKDKTIANLELLYQERLRLELDKTRQTFLLEQKTKDDQITEQRELLSQQTALLDQSQTKISDLESENQKLQQQYTDSSELEQKMKEQIQELEQQKERQMLDQARKNEEFRIREEEYLRTQEEYKKTQEEYKRKEEEYNSKSFFYRLTHKFSLN